MKDPTIADLRSVSAYSVYKGLADFKSYEDTSNELSIAKRNKKKAKRRNKIKEKGNDEIKSSSEEPTASSSQGARKVSEKNGQPTNLVQKNDNDQSPVSKAKRKRQKKKNKKEVNKSNSADSNLSVRVNLSDDEGQPPLKSRKTKEMVPNPLAVRKVAINSNSKSMPTKDVEKTFVKKSKASLNGQVGVSKKPLEKSTSRIEGKPSSSSKIAKQNGLPANAKPTTPKANQKPNLTYVVPSKTSFSKSSPFTVTSKVPPSDIKSVFTSTRIEDSVSQAKRVLEWLLHPVTSDEFMKTYWETKPLLIKRKHSAASDYYKPILTTQLFDDMLRRNPIKYGVNLDITSYVDGKRETLSDNMQGRVRPAVVWDYYSNGCSIRMLNPQTYIQQLWRLNSSLQEWFGSFVGANMYLTPPDSQGFAPHYDDIEAFILQIEGKKRWKLYNSRNEDEVLPRFSSPNFSEEEDNLGEPILDVVLEEGDLLYFPRGVIHQAQTVDGEHSLHITLSCSQLNTYGDLLKHHVNHALDKLIAKDVNFRKGLPTDYLSFMGIAHANASSDNDVKKKRNAFSKKIGELVSKLAKEPADFAADAMGKKFIWDSLPPYLSSKERESTVVEDGEFMQYGKVFNRVEFGPETEVKFIRKNCVRLVVEDEKIKLYYSTENPLTYHEDDEPQFLELDVEVAPAINHLISQYPNYTKIEDLPISSDDIAVKTQIVSDMWERGLLFTKDPLEPCDIDEDFESDDSESDGDKEADVNTTNDAEDDEVESVNLSDLPAEEDTDDDDDFYDTSMGFDSDELGSSIDDEEGGDEDDDVDQMFVNDDNDNEENSEEDDGSGEDFEFGIDEDEDPGLDEDNEDEEDDEFDFDELDRMEETDESDDGE